MLSQAKGATYIFVSREGGVQNLLDIRGLEGRKERMRYVLCRAKGATYTFVSREGDVQNFSVAIGDRITEENIAETAPRGWDSEPGYYASIGRGRCGFDS